MTRGDVQRWLDSRHPAPPRGLRDRLDRAVNSRLPAPDSRLADYLAELGSELLEQVVAQPAGGRELALDLLAADAFATYAFEAQAEEPSHET
jgi:hypothetical protein